MRFDISVGNQGLRNQFFCKQKESYINWEYTNMEAENNQIHLRKKLGVSGVTSSFFQPCSLTFFHRL